ncbi:copper resistance protein NlpE [Sphingobacterium oryzagri]|uniref:Copper resistance protein NlpE n=1 Tax=Sphingobacterium oryzagri TaxID=3025669 RepID=A0ABY7WMM5_9SPHI|nr:copper resistance protein NlpE [Sphingobacterium sp. KACC 22765]WDF70433.1 copper resistance protein NlpE [Sphingobacterium sp. KACC 22765]
MKSILQTLSERLSAARWSTYLFFLSLSFLSCVDLSKPQDEQQGNTGAAETGQATTAQQTGQATTEAAGDRKSTTDESVNLTDFYGTYEGTIPCNDCDGIKTTLVINNNETFNMRTERLGSQQSASDNGRYQLEENGGILHLRAKDTDLKLQIAKDKLLHLDKDGQIIEGALADRYLYRKVK